MNTAEIWIIIIGLGIGTFLLRYSFLAREVAFPEWARRLLRYTSVAVLPGLVAPMVLWPEATGGAVDPARLGAAAVTVAAGIWARSTFIAILAGGVTFYTLLWAL
ncbi:AzlD domain-containing protein [Falsirhodobacter sp. alg1]|uniref:AzlD domain-containing protein n=1 Tax=Falsirhodobacter sp. alg1 TaxID=1472418 RepID=UPI0005EFBABB|nr:AzlD domain-containing protein [Falsirhodobacter sp. alg1]